MHPAHSRPEPGGEGKGSLYCGDGRRLAANFVWFEHTTITGEDGAAKARRIEEVISYIVPAGDLGGSYQDPLESGKRRRADSKKT